MLDPLIVKALSAGFGLLLLLAAVHKLSARHQFLATVKDYQLLPDSMAAGIAPVIPLLEIFLGCGWIFFFHPLWIAMGSAGLFSIYTGAIAINLARGRVHIGCGCGIAGSAEGDQHLSSGLLVRNGVLILLALLATVPVSSRTLGIIDYATVVSVLLAATLLYIAANQLLNNGAAIGAWRHSHD